MLHHFKMQLSVAKINLSRSNLRKETNARFNYLVNLKVVVVSKWKTIVLFLFKVESVFEAKAE